MARMLRPLQNTGRSGTKHTSERVGHRARDAKNKQKSPQQLPGQRFLLRAHGNEVLERSGTDFCQVWTSPGGGGGNLITSHKGTFEIKAKKADKQEAHANEYI